jgi:hypothetical protein
MDDRNVSIGDRVFIPHKGILNSYRMSPESVIYYYLGKDISNPRFEYRKKNRVTVVEKSTI